MSIKNKVLTLKEDLENVKTEIANAITSKGVETANDTSFAGMTENIEKIKAINYDMIDVTTESGQELLVTHTVGENAKDLILTSDTKTDTGLNFKITNGVNEDDIRYKEMKHSISLPYPLGKDEGRVYQKEDGSFEMFRNVKKVSGETYDFDKYSNVPFADGYMVHCMGDFYFVGSNRIAIQKLVNDEWIDVVEGGFSVPSSTRDYFYFASCGNYLCVINSCYPTHAIYNYNVLTNEWEDSVSISSLPPHVLNWGSICSSNDKMYFVGGAASTNTIEYDPKLKTLVVLNGLNIARYNLTSCYHNGKIYALGGTMGLNVLEVFDISKNTWTRCADCNINIANSGLFCYEEKLYCVYENNILVYDITLDAWIGEFEMPWNSTNGLRVRSAFVNDVFYMNIGTDINTLIIKEEYVINKTFEWSTKTDMSTGRGDLTSSVVDNKIYCIGGNINTKVECYDPKTDSWTTKKDMPTKRSNLTSSVVNDKIYCIGGNSGGYRVNTVECYDPVTNTWTTKTGMSTMREGLTSSVVDGKIYVIGGNYGSTLNAVECYDPETDKWSTKTNMPTIRESLTSSVVNDKIYCIGGYSGSHLNKVECYDPKTDSWTTCADMPTKRRQLTSSVVNDKIYVMGGSNGNDLNIVERYDPATDTWETCTDMLIGRRQLTSSVVDGKIYTIGGVTTIYLKAVECLIVEEGYATTEVITLIEENLNFPTFRHMTKIECLNNVKPNIYAKFEVEV